MAADRNQFDRPASSREPVVRPYETREFRNSVESTVAITFVVAGGACWQTAYRRARRIAERLANTAARAKGVVEVRAVAGASRKGEITASERVCFDAANSGRAGSTEPPKLDRYLDSDHERGLVALAQDRTEARARIEADRQRRDAVGCANPWQNWSELARYCGCIYCQPSVHLAERDHPRSSVEPSRCACGRGASEQTGRCAGHRHHQLVALDGDPGELDRLAALWASHPPPEHPRGDDLDGPRDPGLPPPPR